MVQVQTIRRTMKQACRSLVVAACAFAASTAQAGPTGLYVFGDSLLDIGNVYAMTGGTTPAAPYYQGRWSNGPLAVDMMASRLGLSLTSYASGGTNFAFGGAMARSTPASAVPDVIDQVNMYTQLLSSAHMSADKNAIYLLDGGGNDIAAVLNGSASLATLGNSVASMSLSMMNLIGAGAQHLVVYNVPDIGDTPLIRATDAAMSAGGAVRAQASTLTQGYNSILKSAIDIIQMNTGVSISLIDVYSLAKDVTNRPSSYGMTNVQDACLTVGGICSTPSAYMYWDPFHPTFALNSILADHLVAAAIPTPATIALIGLGLIGIGSIRRQRRA